MHILILTIGTRGDVQPYVALGRGLMAAGHRVTVCTCERFKPFIEQHGLEYAFMNDDMLDFMETEDGRIAMENTANLWETLRTAIRLLPKLGDMTRRQLSDSWRSAERVDPDLLLYHPKAVGAKSFAECLGIPCAFAFYLPMYVPTSHFPAMLFPSLPLGAWYNRLTYRMIELATALATDKYVKPWLAKQGMPTKRTRFLERADGSPIWALHAFSPSVIARPDDWPETATVTGYWFLEDTTDWKPSPELERFLASGSPPIYVGFGSIFGLDPGHATKVVVDAIHLSGERAILATGWGGLFVDEVDLPDSIFVIDEAPHDRLFPRVAAVVHHGGCGTTAAAMRAGKPSVVCPFFGDQPFWGSIVHQLGIGPKPIRQKKLTAENLAAAIRVALDDPSMGSSADAVGQRIRSEDGVPAAVAFLDNLLAPRR